MKWIHRLFNPHCPVCIEEDRIRLEVELEKYTSDNTCNTCESLKSENTFLRQQVKDLQDHILHPSIPSEPVINTDELKAIRPLHKPFSIIRSELETADRLKAKQIDEQLKQQAAKSDVISSIVNDEGKIDSNLVEKELENMNREIKANG